MSSDVADGRVVLKIGGSVLTDQQAYERVAEHLARRVAESPNERLVVVVSAQGGVTDELQRLAEMCQAEPDPAALDLLWSTGELRSVATLTLCLRAAGVAAVGLGVHQCGLEVRGEFDRDDALQVNPLHISLHLRRHPIVVVPGFLGCGAGAQVVTLGRGGSDLTAVLLADALGAVRCELIKDVPGYFTKDPNKHADAERVAHLTFDAALVLAAQGCDLVQRRALVAASRTNTELRVHSLDDASPGTTVSATAASVHPTAAAG